MKYVFSLNELSNRFVVSITEELEGINKMFFLEVKDMKAYVNKLYADIMERLMVYWKERSKH